MRLKIVVSSVLFFALKGAAASTVSGIAVAAQWYGANDNMYGGYGDIMEYVISNGTVTNTFVLYAGFARFATISPDGQRVAFLKNNNTVAVVPASGGTATEIVTGLPSSRGYLDWPAGDYVYYSKAGYGEEGSKEIWKVNANTREVSQVCAFNTQMWLWSVALDGNHASVRPSDGQDGGGYGHVYRYLLLEPAVTIQIGNSDDFGQSCGNAVSPDGGTIMCFTGLDHAAIHFYTWDKALIATIPMGTMNSWGIDRGRGMNRNRWSSNSNNWICVMQGWDGRECGQGGNQVLYNWVDHQQLCTSLGASGSSQQNEAGDFWVGDAPTIINEVPSAHNRRVSAKRSGIVLPDGIQDGLQHDHIAARDLRGRRISPQQPGAGTPLLHERTRTNDRAGK
jgi:hypothetical protein